MSDAKNMYTPYPMVLNICGVNREIIKFQNQLLAAANAWPSERVCWLYISEFTTHGVPFHEGV